MCTVLSTALLRLLFKSFENKFKDFYNIIKCYYNANEMIKKTNNYLFSFSF